MKKQQNIDYFLKLINCTIHNDTDMSKEEFEADWAYIYQLAVRNKLVPLLYNTVYQLTETHDIPIEIMSLWKKSARDYMIYESQKYIILRQILKLAEERKLKIIFFKGCILADLYPNYLLRYSSDTDIFVYPQDKVKAVKLFEDLGFRKSCISSKDSVYKYILDSVFYIVELHFSLWEDFKGDKIDKLEKMQLTDEKTLNQIRVCDLEITALGYEEHLIYQIFHIIKHFALQGINIRYLLDITLYINKYEKFLDMDKFWREMEDLKYDTFCKNFFYICMKYFGMSSKIMENRETEIIHNLDEFLLDIMNAGPGYERRTAAWHLVGIIEPYFLGDQDIPKSSFGRKMKMLFPPREVFPIEYARKHPVLLPAAWIQRCFIILIKMLKNRKNMVETKEKIFLSEIRLSLMQNLGLTNGGKK